ncbi:zf-HC2 domain-containing protein [Streptomyces sp. XM4193]|uniref:anti-sigma factor family protein n=1 Tax=Streptomyces sp. XM4193 TaxID=2929782 RepID=UPI001FF9CFE7|nr:zf-HC2 domain-containing protein [Streptomyces sp. XM4193]MCK1798464.1 zf-HC2 domain-containing protein [Streptomyces sp. XM4193]
MTSLAHHQDHHDHHDVGAYAIGALGPEEAERFEAHLADCGRCAAALDELLGLAPLLAEYTETGRAAADAPPGVTAAPDDADARPDADAVPRSAAPAGHHAEPVRAGEALLESVLARAAAERRRRARRRLALAVPAAAVLVAAALGGAALLTGPDTGAPPDPPDPIRAAYDAGEKHHGSAPGSDVDATVSLTEKRWGTEIAVRLTGVTGPRSCGLIAVGRDGGEQTVTTWAVPDTGYGPGKEVYYVGGSAYGPADIDHFEVRTLDGQRLVTVDK